MFVIVVVRSVVIERQSFVSGAVLGRSNWAIENAKRTGLLVNEES